MLGNAVHLLGVNLKRAWYTSTPLCDNGGSFCEVGTTADLFDTICTAFFRSFEFTCFFIILRSLVKDFLTEVKIPTQNHQSAHKFKYGTSTSPER